MPTPSTFRRPESVIVLVYTSGGDVLLLKRQQPFSFWQSVTGGLEAEEDHRSAAARELHEETGLSDEGELYFSGHKRSFEIDPRWRHRYAPENSTNLEYEWRYRLSAPRAVQIDAREHAGYCWMPLEKAIEQVWSWTNQQALQDLRTEL